MSDYNLEQPHALPHVPTETVYICPAESELAAPTGSARTEDLAMLIRRLCRVVARHDANNTVRAQALDYLHRKGLGGSPLKENAPNDQAHA